MSKHSKAQADFTMWVPRGTRRCVRRTRLSIALVAIDFILTVVRNTVKIGAAVTLLLVLVYFVKNSGGYPVYWVKGR
jgi:hypothetical protein